jgi:PhnB protein
MKFYQKCFGGVLSLQTVGESLETESMPVKMKNCIVHAELRNKYMVLLASDMVSEDGLQKGNHISLLFNCTTEIEIKKVYKKLSQGGKQTHPLKYTCWNALFGALTDRYGNNWILNFSGEHLF